jgi:hypothetical protein
MAPNVDLFEMCFATDCQTSVINHHELFMITLHHAFQIKKLKGVHFCFVFMGVFSRRNLNQLCNSAPSCVLCKIADSDKFILERIIRLVINLKIL